MYRVTVIEKMNAPIAGNAQKWYRYVIDNERGNTIVGQRAGTRTEVTRFAHECARHLNEKYPGGRGVDSPTVRRVNLDALSALYY